MRTPAPLRTGSVLVRAVVVFVLATGLTGAGAWVPTQSRDEAATVSAVTRTWSQLGAMLQNVDVVHTLYYASMKVWLDAVGVSTLSLRIPSVLACGLAAGLVVVLGALLVTARAGLLAGLFMAVCPRVTLIATEGRSAAWFTAATVLLVLVVVLAVRRGRWWWGVPVALATTLAGALHLYTALLLPVLLVWLWLPGAGFDRPRALRFGPPRGRVGAVLGLLVGAVPVVVLAWLARAQQAQVDWIEPPTLETLGNIATETVAPGNGLWAVLAWGTAAAGMVWLARNRATYGAATFLLIGWAAFPGLALIAVSAASTPFYSQRYLPFCLGGLAVLAGAGLESVRRRWLTFCLAATLPLAGAVSFRDQRLVDAWDEWGQIAAIFAHTALPGDPVIAYNRAATITVSYPGALGNGPILNAGEDRLSRRSLWDERLPLEAVEPQLRGVERVWYLTPTSAQSQRPGDIGRLRQLGFRGELLERSDAEQTWLFTRTAAQAAKGDVHLRGPR